MILELVLGLLNNLSSTCSSSMGGCGSETAANQLPNRTPTLPLVCLPLVVPAVLGQQQDVVKQMDPTEMQATVTKVCLRWVCQLFSSRENAVAPPFTAASQPAAPSSLCTLDPLLHPLLAPFRPPITLHHSLNATTQQLQDQVQRINTKLQNSLATLSAPTAAGGDGDAAAASNGNSSADAGATTAPRGKIDKMSGEVVDSNPYSRLMALQRMGIVNDYEAIRNKTVGWVG